MLQNLHKNNKRQTIFTNNRLNKLRCGCCLYTAKAFIARDGAIKVNHGVRQGATTTQEQINAAVRQVLEFNHSLALSSKIILNTKDKSPSKFHKYLLP